MMELGGAVHVVAGGVMTQVAIIMKSVITSFEELAGSASMA